MDNAVNDMGARHAATALQRVLQATRSSPSRCYALERWASGIWCETA